MKTCTHGNEVGTCDLCEIDASEAGFHDEIGAASRENAVLRRQLAAANARADTYLGEMVRLQERGEAFERAREAQMVLDRNKSSDPDMNSVEYMAAITAEIDARRVLRAYFATFATGEKEG